MLSSCDNNDLEVIESESSQPSKDKLKNESEAELSDSKLGSEEIESDSLNINNELNDLYKTEDKKFKAYAEHTAKAIEFYTLETNIKDNTKDTDLSAFYPVEDYLYVYDNDIKGIDLSLNGLTSYNEISTPMGEAYRMLNAAKEGDVEIFYEYAENDLEFVENLKEFTQTQNDLIEAPKSIEELTGKTIEQQYDIHEKN